MERKWGLGLLSVGLGAVLLSGGCLERPQPAGPAGGPRQAAAVPVGVTPVTRGAITTEMAYSGGVQAKMQVNILPKVSGRIDRLMVDMGSKVQAGDLIAELDHATWDAQVKQAEAVLAAAQAKLDLLPKQVAVAQAQLEAAQARLDNMHAGSRPEEIAIAEASVAAAQAKLNQLLKPNPADLQTAHSAVDSAQATLTSGQAKLADLRAWPKTVDLTTAQATVDAAQAALQAAQAKLTQLLFPNPADLEAAQASVEIGQASLQSAQAKLHQLKNPSPADLEAAQAAVNTAQANLKAAQERLADLRAQPKPTDVQAAEADVTKYQATLDNARAALASADTWIELYRARGDTANATRFELEANAQRNAIASAEQLLTAARLKLKQVKDGPTAADLQAAQSNVEIYQAALQSAQAKLNQLLKPTPADVATAQAAVDTAQANLDAAKAKLNQLKSPTSTDLQTARSAVDTAQANLTSSQAKLTDLKAGAKEVDLTAAQSAVEAAQAAWQSAQAKLGQLQSPTENDLTVWQAAVNQAASQLTIKQSPYTEYDLRGQRAVVIQAEGQLALTADYRSLEAAVAQAAAALEAARVQQAEAFVRAPFTSLVSQRFVSPGAMASSTTPIVALVSSETEVVLSVEEANIGRLSLGQPASLSVVAYPGEEFAARVSSIAPSADPKSRTFAVKLTPLASDEKLKDGMFAQARITAAERRDALLVPTEALVPRGGKTVAFVVGDGRTQMREVTPGLTDGRKTEVLRGLAEGEQIVIAGQAGLNDGDRVTVTGAPRQERPSGGPSKP